MPGPGYLLVAIKLSDRDSSYIEDALRGSRSNYATTATQSITRDKRRIAKGIADLLTGMAGGTMQGDLWVGVPGTDAVLRTKTISCTQATSADEAVTFACGGVSIVLTEGVDFEAGASDTTEAAALVVAINAHAELGRIFSATSAIGVVTVTAKFPGQVMDDWVLTGGTGLVVATTPGGVVVLGDYGTARIALRNVAQGRTP